MGTHKSESAYHAVIKVYFLSWHQLSINLHEQNSRILGNLKYNSLTSMDHYCTVYIHCMGTTIKNNA